jgi:hypothetical protein
MLIDRGLLGDEGVYVGNADKNFYIAVRQLLRNLDLIQIAGRVIVDGRPQLTAQIAHRGSGGDCGRIRPQLYQLLLDRRREVRPKALMLHDLFGDGLQVKVR